MDDHLLDFDLRPGPPRGDGRQAVNRANRLGRSFKPARRSGGRPAPKMIGRAKTAPGRCSRIGRGQDIANVLSRRTAHRQAGGQRSRRVVIKARITTLKVGSQAAAAHLRYLVRDGVTRDGTPARLYGHEGREAEPGDFNARCAGDRHQFRFIVAPEDGAALSDMPGFVRDLMGQMEEDLGTPLDWVAVDHFNTGHPHSHVIVRGRDDLGKDLIIAQDYITSGLRHRAEDLVTLELGPATELETARKLEAEITAERLTRIDRALLEDLDPQRRIDVRPMAGQIRAEADATLRLGRLKTLEGMGLAEQTAPGVWTLSPDVDATLRAMGERGDIIRAMSRAVSRRGQDRSPEAFVIDPAGEASTPKIGRVIDKRLTDELADRIGLVVDGLDGRVRHVEVDGEAAAEISIGAIVETGATPSARPADRTIANLAADGVYRPRDHQERLERGELRLPTGAKPEDLVEAHVRRLEALRRAGIVERWTDNAWHVPADYLKQVEGYQVTQGRRAQARLLSALDLDRQVSSEGATWLDRQLVGKGPPEAAPTGFGSEVTRALERRRTVLVQRGEAFGSGDGWRARPGLIARLERQEVARIGEEMAKARELPFRALQVGETIKGRLADSVQLASGKFAVIEGSYDFTLVPWRPALERYRGQSIAGTVEMGGGVTWQLGRQRGLGL